MTAELQSWVQIKIHRKGFHKKRIQRLTSSPFWILFYLRGSKELSTEKTLPKTFYKGLCSGLHVVMFWSALGLSLCYPSPHPQQCCAQKRTHFHPFRSQVNIVCGGSHLSFTDQYHWRVPNTSDLLCSLSSTLKSNIFMLSMKWS